MLPAPRSTGTRLTTQRSGPWILRGLITSVLYLTLTRTLRSDLAAEEAAELAAAS